MRQAVALRQVADMKHDSPASAEPTIWNLNCSDVGVFRCQIFSSARYQESDGILLRFYSSQLIFNSKKARPVDTNTKRIYFDCDSGFLLECQSVSQSVSQSVIISNSWKARAVDIAQRIAMAGTIIVLNLKRRKGHNLVFLDQKFKVESLILMNWAFSLFTVFGNQVPVLVVEVWIL